MEIPVIIVGGGPVGLACSLFLSRYGIKHLLVEKHPGTSFHPKAMGLQTHTMEIFRSYGIADELAAQSIPEEWTHNTYWCRSLLGEILRVIPVTGETAAPSWSPERGLHCPQTLTEAVLLKHALLSPSAEIRFHHEMLSFVHDGGGVETKIRSRETGEDFTVRSEYLLAADGAHGSIRESLGIAKLGPPDMGHFANIYFKADAGGRMQDRKGILYNCLTGEDYGSVVAIDGTSHWLMHHFMLPGESAATYTPEYSRTLVSQISGISESEIEILGVSPWVMSAQVSDRFREGRIFLTGDAAHRTTPAGGLGLNTGIQSAHNLCWKLAAVLNDWGSEALLETYETERRQIVLSNVEQSRDRAMGLFGLIEAACTGRWDEAMAMLQSLPATHSATARDLGYRYTAGAFSGVDPAAENIPSGKYQPVAEPGCRAPHLWVESSGRRTSVLDLFGHGFILLTGGAASEWDRAVEAFHSTSRIPLSVQTIPDQSFLHAYGLEAGGAVIVRPDGFIFWKSRHLPEQPEKVIQEAFRETIG